MYNQILLGALLHDIGKVGQRSFSSGSGLSKQSLSLKEYICPQDKKGYRSHLHVLYTNEFFEQIKEFLPDSFSYAEIANLASYHHRPADKNQEIITTADRLSSALEREALEVADIPGDFRAVPLRPVANYINIKNSVGNSDDYILPLGKYSSNSIFPFRLNESKGLQDSYMEIWNGLIETISGASIKDPIKYTNTLLSILEKYLWAVPSATNVEIPDISLFDHMKTTSAIAGCLYLAEASKEPFVLAAGEFGGIQKYIFNPKPGSGQLAKAIRGRSFKVNTLSDSAAFTILHKLNLALSHMVLSAGGKFLLLLPNNDKTIRALTQTKQALHEWILNEYFGELRFNLEWIEASKSDIKDFPGTLTRLNDSLLDSSLRGLIQLKNPQGWEETKWLGPIFEGRYEDLCRSCQSKIAENERSLCADCDNDREIGSDFARSNFQSFSFQPDLKYKLPFDTSFDLRSKISENERSADIVIEFKGEIRQKFDTPFFSILKNNYVPLTEDGSILDFEKIAGQSNGNKQLGYLKADIDNLGYIFARGLADSGNNSDRKSISRLATLSRSLEYFFSGFIYYFLKNDYPHTYTVFSGGDDLLFIGPWDKIFALASDLHSKFKEFTCNNNSWGLSAGIALAGHHTPLLSGLEMANRSLSASKKLAGKDSITAFSTTLKWGQFEDALSQAENLIGWYNNGVINSAKIYRLLHYASQLDDFRQSGNTTLLRVIPQMIYDLKRNWQEREDIQRQAKAWAHAYTNPEYKDSPLLSFICQYVINKIR
ncbi:MAG: type III-A CRISPR-associated protein Cas10/Csm1 [candidate division Zixibacteria bacterium HGW-Zixibacteria-1]|nr:MAG: type III-A CRISPR-associated protein Cas10/Csm1 [candidate division Zixibacteria bacterium HGW-Zixibacteria-1]